MSPLAWSGVALIGAFGALARFHADAFIQRVTSATFPLGTLAINLSGAFVLGVLTASTLSGRALTLIGTAGIGSFTTFSTWMLETDRLAEDGELTLAVANIVVSLLLGLTAAAVGWRIGGAL